jgi:hypothetical protein
MSVTLIIVSYLPDVTALESAIAGMTTGIRVKCSPRCIKGTMIQSILDPKTLAATSVVAPVGVTKPNAAFVLDFDDKAMCIQWCASEANALVGAWILMIE